LNLQNYDNQARVFLHEVTHLNYFMNAKADHKNKGENPFITDLEISYRDGRGKDNLVIEEAYGVLRAKMTASYRDPTDSGYYAQRNGIAPLYDLAIQC